MAGNFQPPASVYQVIGLQGCTTTPGFGNTLFAKQSGSITTSLAYGSISTSTKLKQEKKENINTSDLKSRDSSITECPKLLSNAITYSIRTFISVKIEAQGF